ncbi:Nif3-like dinuclear metal center hexameric protein [Trichlorobacter sp.]|uniref:Nif3-like dinuclear metal center hexameric protein n=1 Tax=Trichlorobacter sp. TaxID=2911007 RepID=UPI002A36947F|nr:Nif3-like dinuclear metal center hexameric protein [Trichlorobacter sp.]MDY0384569.1 Nif3-like dinuclear metal center hexameric protein [Trichlorobacter sp.]
MKAAKISDIVGIIGKKYPFGLAEEWDNVGLQLGDPAGAVERVMVALDPLPEVLDQALSRNCQLLITHHPLIFKPLRQITTGSITGKLVLQAASHGLALVAMHTNYDIADGGLNDLLAERLGLQQLRPLTVTDQQQLVKLVVFVPEGALEAVRQAMFAEGCALGNYRDCSFTTTGEGTFTPLPGAEPAIGAVGRLERVAECRLELLVQRDRLAKAMQTLLKVHPYEEPAFDCYPLLNQGHAQGLGRIGVLETPSTLAAYSDQVRERLQSGPVRLVGDPSRLVRSVALCSGSGASLLKDAVRAGADLLVTGDVKYHEAREAEASGIALLDVGHFASEQLMVVAVQQFLQTTLTAAGYACDVLAAEGERDPFQVRCL